MNGKLLLNKSAKQFIATVLVLFATVSLGRAQGNFKVFNFTTTGALRTTTATSDGGMILGSFGVTTLPSVPASFIKLDSNGDMVWSKRIYESSTSFSFYPGGHSKIVGTNDAGALILSDILKKIDAMGNIEWALSLPVENIIQTQDQNYLASINIPDPNNNNNNIIQLTKISSTGVILWKKQIGVYGCFASKMIEKDADNIIIFGSQYFQGTSTNNMFLSSININNNLINWSRVYSVPGRSVAGSVLIITADSALVCGGYTQDINAIESDNCVVKFDLQGNIIWSKTMSGASDEYITGGIIAQDGGYVFAGSTDSYGAGLGDVHCFKLAQNGDQVWNRTLGGAGNEGTTGIIKSSGDSFFLLGGTQSIQCIPYTFIAKLDETTSNCWDSGSGGNMADISLVADTNNISIANDSLMQADTVTIFQEVLAVTFSEQCPVMCSSVGLESASSLGDVAISPNPASEFIMLEGIGQGNSVFTFTNVIGQKVLEGELTKGNNTIDIRSLETGIYLLKIQNEGKITFKKFVKE